MNVKFLVLNLTNQKEIEKFETNLRELLNKGWVVEDTYDMEGAIVFYLSTVMEQNN